LDFVLPQDLAISTLLLGGVAWASVLSLERQSGIKTTL
jgi:hypothetical protein